MKKFYLLIILIGIFNYIKAQNQYPNSWQPRGVGGGGALYSPTINPANENEYYVACDMSDIFHTTDFGDSYNQLNFQQIVSGSWDKKVCFTNVSGLLYSITANQDNSYAVKSSDNGVTWTSFKNNPDSTDDIFTIDGDYNNSNRIIFTYWSQIYFSKDGGNTFSLIHTALTGQGCVEAGVFCDKDTIYIGTNDGLLVSKNGGSSFVLQATNGIPTTEAIVSFSGARTGKTIRFYCLTGLSGNVYGGMNGSDCYGLLAGVYTLDNNSGSWQSKMSGININTDDPMFVGMAQNDINTCYLAGSNSSYVPEILKTTNGGANWFETFNTTSNQNIITGWSGTGGDRNFTWGQLAYEIAVAPNNSNYAIFSDMGFVHRTTNGGQMWQQAYVNISDQHPAGSLTPDKQYYHSIGLENTSCWQILWLDKNNMFACYTDIQGISSTDAGNSWSFNYTGTSANTIYRMVQNTTNGYLYAATSNIHDMYQSTRLKDAQLDASDGAGNVIYSTNKGSTWNIMHVFGHPVFWLTADPNNQNTLYASVIDYGNGSGAGGIYVCKDANDLATSQWTKLANPNRTQGHPACIVVLNDGTVVCSYSGRIDATTGKFTNSSGVFIYNASNSSWTTTYLIRVCITGQRI